MAHPGFGHLWQRPVLSDVDVLLCVENAAKLNQESAHSSASDNLGKAHTVLQQFPAHGSILTLSPVFEAQMLRWQTEEPAAAAAAAADSSSSCCRRQIKLTLPDDSYEPAAMAVLAVLYWMKPVQEQLAELTGDQQVQAAVLADMWQVPAAGSAAVELLTAATNSAEGLPAAAFDLLLGLPALPPSLLPVLQQALLSRFGDLEAVWADAALQKALLEVPLFAVELLLSSDKLKVASEDTVLYTAQAYVKRLPTAQRQLAQDRLAPLVRCPRLSQFWWAAAVLSDDAPTLLLSGLQPQLKRLLLAQLGSNAKLTADEIKADVPDVPASWRLPARVTKPVSSVGVEWVVTVVDIRRAALKAASSGEKVRLDSPSTAPLQGITWHMELECGVTKKGSMVAVYVGTDNMPAHMAVCIRDTVECVGFVRPRTATDRFQGRISLGWDDYFGIGAMPGGFDAAVWAAKGLPAEGQLVFKLKVERAN